VGIARCGYCCGYSLYLFFCTPWRRLASAYRRRKLAIRAARLPRAAAARPIRSTAGRLSNVAVDTKSSPALIEGRANKKKKIGAACATCSTGQRRAADVRRT